MSRWNMRAMLKRLPGVSGGIRLYRAGQFRMVLGLLTRLLRWTSRTPARRAIEFDALQGRYGLAQHAKESYLVYSADRTISRIVYFSGEFDFEKFEKAYRLLRQWAPAMNRSELPVLFDVGANIGSICIPAVARGLVSRCIAFEPDGENFRLLRINALLNDVHDRIDAHRAAVGDSRATVSLLRSPSNCGDHRVQLDGQDDADTVAMIVLDDFADGLDLRNTVLWMDIQGFEGFAVAGASRFLAAGSPLIVEFCKADMDAAGSFDSLLTALEHSAYTVFFDLGEEPPSRRALSQEALRALAARLDREGDLTDLLFLSDRDRSQA